MTKFVGSGVLSKVSQEVDLQGPINVSDIPNLLNIKEPLSDHLIVVRDHRLLFDNDVINDDDEINLYLAVMGG